MGARGRYGVVLRRPHVARTLTSYVVARLSATTVSLAILLLTQHQSRSFGIAGLLSGCFAGAAAFVAPVLGRQVDQRGQFPIVLACGLMQPVALVGLLAAVTHGSTPLAALAALVAGGLTPPVTSCMRALWPTIVDAEKEPTAWAIEGIIVEATELSGPLVVALMILLVSPAAALLAAAGLALIGCLSFAFAPASRSWSSQRETERGGLTLGPLRDRGVLALVLVVLLATAGLAALEVSIASFATRRHQTDLTGLLFSIWLTGSLLGGWFYGSRQWRSGSHRHLPVIMGLGAVTTLGPVLGHGASSMAALLFVAGLFIAPATSAQFGVLTKAAPEHSRTESFTWASTAAFLGVAAGTALCGQVVEAWGTRPGIVLSAVLTGIGALLAFGRRDVLGGDREVFHFTGPAFEQVLPTQLTVDDASDDLDLDLDLERRTS